MTTNPTEEFRSALRGVGLDYVGPLTPDGKLHRVKCEGDKDPSAWYVLYNDGPIMAGAFGCWRRQINEKWKATNGEMPRGKELADIQRKWRQAEEQRTKDELDRHQRMSEKAIADIAAAEAPDPNHLYLQTKKVGIHGPLKQTPDGDLVLSLYDGAGRVFSYQTVDGLGDKLFMPGGRVQGCFYPIHDRKDGPLVICEGYATGASIYQATGWATVCAMNCGNLLLVSKHFRQQYPKRVIIIAADDDRFTQGKNPGIEKGKEAASVTGSLLAFPKFKANSTTGTDFNDLARSEGLSAVQSQLETIAGMGIGTRISIAQLLDFQSESDPQCVIGNRYLCKGGSLIIVGQTHVGKSSFGLQMAITLSLGGDFFGIASNPVRPLKSLYIQAENDLGDMAEMLQGILIGTGQVGNGPERDGQIGLMLKKNLIIVRDQTHIGPHFAAACRKLIELHQPDLVFFDPLLSFYGNDINDQQAAGEFLRGQLNPISEETGIIWVALHHTGKPMRDATKTTKNWKTSDFSYMGLGSSEFSNWPRAIISIVAAGEDEFRVILSKRGWRAEAKDDQGNPTNELYLAHASNHICWKQIPKPPEDEQTQELCQKFANSLGSEVEPMKASEIVKLAEKFLSRGTRTIWKLWDRGEGPLGCQFKRDSNGLYLPS